MQQNYAMPIQPMQPMMQPMQPVMQPMQPMGMTMMAMQQQPFAMSMPTRPKMMPTIPPIPGIDTNYLESATTMQVKTVGEEAATLVPFFCMNYDSTKKPRVFEISVPNMDGTGQVTSQIQVLSATYSKIASCFCGAGTFSSEWKLIEKTDAKRAASSQNQIVLRMKRNDSCSSSGEIEKRAEIKTADRNSIAYMEGIKCDPMTSYDSEGNQHTDWNYSWAIKSMHTDMNIFCLKAENRWTEFAKLFKQSGGVSTTIYIYETDDCSPMNIVGKIQCQGKDKPMTFQFPANANWENKLQIILAAVRMVSVADENVSWAGFFAIFFIFMLMMVLGPVVGPIIFEGQHMDNGGYDYYGDY